MRRRICCRQAWWSVDNVQLSCFSLYACVWSVDNVTVVVFLSRHVCVCVWSVDNVTAVMFLSRHVCVVS